MAKESVLGVFEKIIAPFHNVSIAITAIGALSIHTLLTQLFEPLIHVYFTLLLTFPLTIGLIIVFLILYNTNWKNTTLVHVLLAPAPVAILFMLLTTISDNYGLEKMGLKKHEEEEKINGADKKEIRQQPAVVAVPISPVNNKFNPENLKKMAGESVTADSMARYREANQPWYEKVPIIKNLVWGLAYLKESFIKMYTNYGSTRFISGVLLALFLTWYIQTKGINKIMAAQKEPADNKHE